MIKKTISFFLTLSMILGMAGCASAASNTFSDVDSNADYAAAVEWCYQEGLMNGVGDGKFDPAGTLTRAMLATTLYRAKGEPAVNGKPNYTDAKVDTWYSDAVIWSSGEKLIQGYGNGLFGVDDPVSVEQLQVILDRYTEKGDTWVGDPAKAHAATRAQVAIALIENLKPADPEPTRQPSGGNSGGGSSHPVTPPTPEQPQENENKVLVAYFSCTNNTKGVAEKIAHTTGGDLYEITPAVPYTSADLNYNSDCRANREQNDPAARPTIDGDVENWENYDVVFMGYPIWWGVPPKIVHTFMESYDFSGKTVVPFCTSGSSPYNDDAIKALAPAATWLTGQRFSAGASQSAVDSWVKGLNLPQNKEESAVNKLYVSFNGHTYTATLSDNTSAQAFVSYLKEQGGAVTISTSDYGSFEKVGALGASLVTNNEQINTVPGDIILYQGSNVCLYYATNSWNFTRLGRLDGDLSSLKANLGSGDVSITYSLNAETPAPSVAVFDLASGTNGNAPMVTLNSGHKMPVAGIGTYSLKGDECVSSIKSALEQGVRLIDTAYMYGNEAEVGQAVREFMAESDTPREDIFVITKLYPGEQFSNPEKAIQNALDKLDIGYIDMMLLHHPGANDVKAYKVMEQAVADGKIHSLGLSNWYIEEIDDFIAQVSIKPALVQNEIHPYYQEQEVIPYMNGLGIVMQAWYPLGGRGYQRELLSDETLMEIARTHGVSVAQVILRWDLQNGVVIIPGSSNPDHIKENISLFDFELTEEEMTAIAALDRGEKHDWY